jgi:hypothetical protein
LIHQTDEILSLSSFQTSWRQKLEGLAAIQSRLE